MSQAPDLDRVWTVDHAQKLGQEGSEVWLICIENKMPEPAMVRLIVRAYTDDGKLAGWGIECPTLDKGRHAVRVRVNVPASMQEGRAAGQTTIECRSVWIGDMGTCPELSGC